MHESRYLEHVIRRFSDRVDWDLISEYQDLSEKFIREFKDKVNWEKFCPIKNFLKILFWSVNKVKEMCCIQGVPGGKDLTSGECSLGQTIPI